MASENITVSSTLYIKVKTFKYLGSLLTNNSIKCRLKAETLLLFSPKSSQLLSKNLKIKIENNNIVSCAIWL